MSSKSIIKPLLASQEDCTGCFACIAACHKGALSQYTENDGHRYILFDESRCVGCKACERVCSLSRSYYGNNDLDKSKVFAGWSLDVEDRKNATSGGVFASLAKYVLKNGGCVVGACLYGRECKHTLITQITELGKLQGSKYIASSMDNIYKIIESKVSEGLVLFSGVGCQCAGILAYFENSPYKSNLITVDLVCAGSPSQILLDKFYERYPEIEKIVSFRDKDKYCLKVQVDSKIYTISDKSLPLHGFNCELTNRMNCYKCQFACAHRKTDITLADLWNYDYKREEHARGISTVMVHTEKGMSILSQANVKINSIKWSQCINYCKRIVWGKDVVFAPRKNLVNNATNMEYDEFLKLYCIAMKPSDIKMELFRIYRYILKKINDYNAKRYIASILRKYNE